MQLAHERRNPQITPAHLLAVLLETGAQASGHEGTQAARGGGIDGAGGVVLPVLAKLGTSLPALRAETERALEEQPRLAEGSSTEGGQPSSELTAVLRAAEQEAAPALRPLRLDRAPAARARCPGGPRRRRAARGRRDPRAPADSARARSAGPHRVDRPEPRGPLPGARALRARPHRSSPRRASSTP